MKPELERERTQSVGRGLEKAMWAAVHDGKLRGRAGLLRRMEDRLCQEAQSSFSLVLQRGDKDPGLIQVEREGRTDSSSSAGENNNSLGLCP